jgi:aryl-alcohol dehydrogenase-like predicted oxidoreductase
MERPVLSVGCRQFGGCEYWGNVDQSDVNKIVRRALALGANYFDTAEIYSDCQISVPLQNNCAHREVLRARINLAPTPVVTVTQSEHIYDNSYKTREGGKRLSALL